MNTRTGLQKMKYHESMEIYVNRIIIVIFYNVRPIVFYNQSYYKASFYIYIYNV